MKTAVEWFVEELTKQNMFMDLFKEEIEQAKEMEKEQIMTAFTQGDIFGADFFDRVSITAEQYYNKNFKSE